MSFKLWLLTFLFCQKHACLPQKCNTEQFEIRKFSLAKRHIWRHMSNISPPIRSEDACVKTIEVTLHYNNWMTVQVLTDFCSFTESVSIKIFKGSFHYRYFHLSPAYSTVMNTDIPNYVQQRIYWHENKNVVTRVRHRHHLRWYHALYFASVSLFRNESISY